VEINSPAYTCALHVYTEELDGATFRGTVNAIIDLGKGVGIVLLEAAVGPLPPGVTYDSVA
jgi:hypothetical protein